MNAKTVAKNFFKEFGKKRLNRILFCAFSIALVWCAVDLINGRFSFNIYHDIIALFLGVVMEKCISWGKESKK